MTMMDDFDLDDMELEDKPQPGESSNRTFIMVAGILGGVLVLSLVCIAVYAMVFLPRNRDAKSTEVADINAQNTEVAMLSAMTAEAKSWTSTPTVISTREANTPTPVLAPTDTPALDKNAASTVDPRTATVAALFTQQAELELTITPKSTSLPDTGFMDNVGIPGLVALAASLVLVIFLARRLRTGS
jgi:hypothetical protein